MLVSLLLRQEDMMDKQTLQKAIEESKKNSKDRKFTQSIDLIISLKEFDIKREEKIEDFVRLPHKRSKVNKICAIVGPELKEQAEKNADKVILAENFPKWNKPRVTKKLADEYEFFIAQATIMPQIAQVFGKYFGPRGKMPNPKAGSVVAPNANLSPLVEKLKDTVKILISKTPVVQCSLGDEKMDTDKLSENAVAVIMALENKLPRGKHNIKKVFIKTTMGTAVRVE